MSSQEMIENWNGEVGLRWAEMADQMDSILAPVATYLLNQIELSNDMHVLDIGCGAGTTTLAVAHKVTGGRALGLDVSGPLLKVAKERAVLQGLKQASFVQQDAESWAYSGPLFDLVMSRFGVMFFEDPQVAFANIRTMMKPGGKLLFIAWRQPEHADLLSIPMRAVAPFLKEEIERPAPNAPGPFGLADGERTQELLKQAGWSDILVEPVDLEVRLNAEEQERFYEPTPIAEIVKAQGLDEAPIRRAIAEALNAKQDATGEAVLKAGVWRISARA